MHTKNNRRRSWVITYYFFAAIAGSVALFSAGHWIRSAMNFSLADKAAASWQSYPAKLTKIEPFVRQSSLYYKVSISYVWQQEDRIFFESWIPRDWWDEGVGTKSIGDTVTLWVNPNSPDQRMWNPRFQADRYQSRISKEQSYFWAGLAASIAFSTVGVLISKRAST